MKDSLTAVNVSVPAYTSGPRKVSIEMKVAKGPAEAELEDVGMVIDVGVLDSVMEAKLQLLNKASATLHP